MRKKAVFFDAGETLVYRNPSLETIALRYFEKGKRVVSRDKLEKAMRGAAVDMKMIVEKGRLSDSAKWNAYMKKVYRRLGVKNFPLDSELKHRLKKGTSFRAHKDVFAALRFLQRKKIITGVISNAPAELRGILKKTKLWRFFDYIVISELAGAEKPDRRIFKKALSLAKVRPEETVYIGDNYLADIAGARRAGIEPVWLRRRVLKNHFSFTGAAAGKTRTVRDMKSFVNMLVKEGWV